MNEIESEYKKHATPKVQGNKDRVKIKETYGELTLLITEDDKVHWFLTKDIISYVLPIIHKEI